MNSEKPVFIQIIEMIEDDILSGLYNPGELIISTPQISKLLSVNPTTAQKAVGILLERGIVYKKRGVGMAVSDGARDKILAEQRERFFKVDVPEFIGRAKKIGVSNSQLLEIIRGKLDD